MLTRRAAFESRATALRSGVFFCFQINVLRGAAVVVRDFCAHLVAAQLAALEESVFA
ncbi:hypothetical protein ACFL12_02330 [Pseudomonadota bacterium]